MLDLIKYKNWFLMFSAAAVIISLSGIAVYGFNLGVDFKSGSLWQMRVPGTTETELKEFLVSQLSLQNPIISYDVSSDSYSLLLPEIEPETKTAYLNALTQKFGRVEELDFSVTSPSVSKELSRKAFWAIGLVLLAISLYITFAFAGVSRPVSSYKYGIITLLTLAHDAAISAGFFAVFAHFRGLAIDTNFIVALLTIVGFSVHDTIVVFDRIRENLMRNYGKGDLAKIVNQSVNETFHRSLNTSLTLVLVLAAVYFLGPVAVSYFVLTILIGTIFGTYSSIFVASPLLVIWHTLDLRRKKL